MNDIPLDFIKKNYGKNYEKVVELYKRELAKLKGDFFRKYPSADTSKFDFQLSVAKDGTLESSDVYYNVDDISAFDIESDDFKNNSEYTKYLYSGKYKATPRSHKWPKIWSDNGRTKPEFTRLRYPKDPLTGCDDKRCGIAMDSKFQEPADLKQSLHNFRVYVNERDYFMSNLPHVYVRWSSGKIFNEKGLHDIRKSGFDYKNEPYFAMICGAYIASYLSGLSLLNLQSDSKLITTFVRYHLYYQIRKFMRHPKLIDHYEVKEVRDHIPVVYKEHESVGTDGDGNRYIYRAAVESSGTDYRSFISFYSDGLTKVGQKLFQESLESFNYCVLGAEARTRWSIVGKGARSSQTQDIFRRIVEDTIVQNDTTVLISNMRKSIQATNVVLNLAVVPNVILMPSNFIILSEKIRGYNNILTTATNEMSFGVNKDVNYAKLPKIKHPEHKSDGLIDDYIHNNGSNGSGNTSNNDNNVHDSVRGDNKRFKTAGNPQLPIMFFISLAAGVIISKKINFTK